MLPDALDEPAAFSDALAELVRTEGADLLMPISEGALLAVLPERERYANCRIPFPDADRFRAISDKQRVLAEAATVGIHVPAQVVVPDPEHLATLPPDMSFPVALKPARTIGEADGERVKVGVRYAQDVDDLREQVRQMSPASFPLLVQQRIVGPGIGIFVLIENGELRAAFAHRRLAEKPPAGGVSVWCESVPMDAELLERSRALLERFHWNGVAMVEFKRDLRTGKAWLMEINGRFWGSLQLAIDAGVDFPRMLACPREMESPSSASYAIGVRSRWWWGEVDHLVSRLRRRGVNRVLPGGTIGAGRVLGDLAFGWLRPRNRDCVFRFDDARPFWRESMNWVRGS